MEPTFLTSPAEKAIIDAIILVIHWFILVGVVTTLAIILALVKKAVSKRK